MNPVNNVKNAKKIIEYSLSPIIEEIPEYLELYFKVNNNWAEVVIYYLDHIWNKKDLYGETVWHYAIEDIVSNKFWEVISQKDDDFFKKFWNIPNKKGNTAWHYAVEEISSKKFWEVIAQKDDQWFEKFWNIPDIHGDTVWHYAVYFLKSENFWELIAQKDKSFFQSWDQKDNDGKTFWYFVEKKITSKYKNTILKKKNNI
jgi:hypothetical protein